LALRRFETTPIGRLALRRFETTPIGRLAFPDFREWRHVVIYASSGSAAGPVDEGHRQGGKDD
jgi:hypothetical protein